MGYHLRAKKRGEDKWIILILLWAGYNLPEFKVIDMEMRENCKCYTLLKC